MANHRRDECEAVIDDCLDLLLSADASLTPALAAGDLIDAVELAERVERLARAVHRMQVRAAGAVEAESPAVRRSDPPPEAPFRRGSDLLRTRLRISGREAARRIRAASAVLPRSALSGEQLEPLAPVLSAGIGLVGGAAGDRRGSPVGWEGDEDGGRGVAQDHLAVAPGPEVVDVVLRTLEDVRAVAAPDVLADVERTLVGYAETFDPETMRRVARRLVSLLDPDGVEPTDRDAASRQGVKVGATWHGLTHLDIWADAVQAEVLMTVFDTGTNPRSAAPPAVPDDRVEHGGRSEGGRDDGGVSGNGNVGAGAGEPSLTLLPAGGTTPAAPVDDRTRPQRMLDALVNACQAALRSAHLPSVGGLPPQLLVTVGLGDLQAVTRHLITDVPPRRHAAGPPRPPWPPGQFRAATEPEPGPGPGPRFKSEPEPEPEPKPESESESLTEGAAPPLGRTGWGRLPHAGPVPAPLLRRLACDADVIPVVMDGESEVLDVGRARRLVPATMRRALIARDGGCLFPGCTIPATWTEGHHVVPWSHGGATSIDNTALLCSAHHHAVHSGRWVVEADPRWIGTRDPRTRAVTPAGVSRGRDPWADATAGGRVGPAGSGPSAQSRREVVRPFRVTPPWAAHGRQTWNAYPVGA